MLDDGGIEWGDPLPRNVSPLDPDLVELLGRGVQVITPEMIEEVRAKVPFGIEPLMSCYWVVRLVDGNALLRASSVGVLDQINVAPDTRSLLQIAGSNLPMGCREQILRQLNGESPCGTPVRVEPAPLTDLPTIRHDQIDDMIHLLSTASVQNYAGARRRQDDATSRAFEEHISNSIAQSLRGGPLGSGHGDVQVLDGRANTIRNQSDAMRSIEERIRRMTEERQHQAETLAEINRALSGMQARLDGATRDVPDVPDVAGDTGDDVPTSIFVPNGLQIGLRELRRLFGGRGD